MYPVHAYVSKSRQNGVPSHESGSMLLVTRFDERPPGREGSAVMSVGEGANEQGPGCFVARPHYGAVGAFSGFLRSSPDFWSPDFWSPDFCLQTLSSFFFVSRFPVFFLLRTDIRTAYAKVFAKYMQKFLLLFSPQKHLLTCYVC